MIMNEMVHDARVVRLNSKHVAPEIKYWLGDSIGWWEGDTLVVDTTNFKPYSGFAGTTETLHVVERFTRKDADTLLYEFKVEDPVDLDRLVERRHVVARDEHARGARLRVRLPRGQLRHGQHPARRAPAGSGGGPEAQRRVAPLPPAADSPVGRGQGPEEGAARKRSIAST